MARHSPDHDLGDVLRSARVHDRRDRVAERLMARRGRVEDRRSRRASRARGCRDAPSEPEHRPRRCSVAILSTVAAVMLPTLPRAARASEERRAHLLEQVEARVRRRRIDAERDGDPRVEHRPGPGAMPSASFMLDLRAVHDARARSAPGSPTSSGVTCTACATTRRRPERAHLRRRTPSASCRNDSGRASRASGNSLRAALARARRARAPRGSRRGGTRAVVPPRARARRPGGTSSADRSRACAASSRTGGRRGRAASASNGSSDLGPVRVLVAATCCRTLPGRRPSAGRSPRRRATPSSRKKLSPDERDAAAEQLLRGRAGPAREDVGLAARLADRREQAVHHPVEERPVVGAAAEERRAADGSVRRDEAGDHDRAASGVGRRRSRPAARRRRRRRSARPRRRASPESARAPSR